MGFRLGALLRNWLRRGAVDRLLDEELRACLQILIDKKVAAGMSPQRARREALIELGGVERVKEEVRGVRMGAFVETLWKDFHYAWRRLAKNPGFAFVAILTLALGIGAGAAMFGIVNGVLLKPLPYPDSERLVRIYQSNSPSNRWSLSVVDFRAIVERGRTFESVAAWGISESVVSGGARPEWVLAGKASAGFFKTLGVHAAEGRTFREGEDRPGAEPVVVLSHAFKTRYFGEGVEAVGRTLTLDGASHTVVGVLPAGLRELVGLRADVWPILRLEEPTRRGPFFIRGLGRLRPGVSLEECRADLASVSEQIYPIWASSFQDSKARLTPLSLRETLVGEIRTSLLLAFAAAGLVLLIAVVNVVNLVLARAAGRQREIALRSALGAGKARLARLLVVEGLLLAGLGGVAGALVAKAGVAIFARLAEGLPRVHEVAVDGTVLAFAAALAALAGICFGVSPLLFGLTPDLASSLKGEERNLSPGAATQAFRGALVAAEFAMAVPLLLAAGLLMVSLWNLQRVDPGFGVSNLVTARLSLPEQSYPDAAAVRRFWSEALRGIESLPGVAAVGISSGMPPDELAMSNNFELLDQPVEPGESQPVAPWSTVTPGFFEALGVPLLEGRWFDSRDRADSPPVLLVSKAWAERFYPGDSAVGKRMRSGGCTTCEPETVVGVVGNVKLNGLAGGDEAVYMPFEQWSYSHMALLARSEGAPASLGRLIEEKLHALDPNLPMAETETMEGRLAASVAEPRHWTLLLGVFAATALALAAVGVYGVLSYFVSRQKREIGIRMALGADRRDVVRMVVWRGMRLAAVGVAVGWGLSFFVTRWLRTLLFEVDPGDPRIMAGVCGMLLLVALAGCYLPGRRASRVDPKTALCE